MKLISWNVNGLRAAWNHGASAFLDTFGADIFALQETRIDFPYAPAELDGYYPYWSFCKTRRGYSGTLCLSRYEALGASYNLGDPDFDTEGRIITLEFEEFYFVNSYTPNPLRSEYRRDYRSQWDERFIRHIEALQSQKPVILCSDFNTTASGADIYEENQRAERDTEGFQSPERENLIALADKGLVDTYRLLHPDENKYTWWSQRLFKRLEDRGWRLDYFLVSEPLKERVRESTMLSDVHGSDHCPILLEIDMDFNALAKAIDLSQGLPYVYQDPVERKMRNRIARHLRRRELEALWNSVNWEEAERHLAEMQRSLAMAAYMKDYETITKRQRHIVRSLDARLLAVRHTCSTAGGPGVDGVKWSKPHEMMSAAFSLTARDYYAMPARLLLITSKNGKQRRIHVETYHDRAMQCLYAFALDPVAEAWGDRKSFAYRKGRSFFDLNEHIKQALSGNDAPEWIFIGDVRQCYENISHDWAMQHIPMAPRVLRQFLKAGFVFGGKLFPMDTGVGIGCSISPIVANMTLDGLQQHIYDRLYPDKSNIDYADGDLMRYADDILVMARTEETARKIRGYIAEFLEERGLALSLEKSRIVHVSQGFTFMSRTYFKSGNRLFARPSNSAIERMMTTLRDTIEGYSGSQQKLIRKINRAATGWASYHKTDEADEAFRRMDAYINALLLELCESKHPKWDREKILEKYWYCDANGRYCYALPGKKEEHVNFLEDTQLINYEPVRTNINPYVDVDYLNRRTRQRDINHVTGVYRGVWNRQGGCCYYCGRKIQRDDDKTLIETDPKKSRFAARMSYVHTRCLSGSLEHIDAPDVPASVNDLRALLLLLEAGHKPVGQKFHKLYEHFRTSTADPLILTFTDIEAIMGEPLGKSARQKQYWQRTGFLCISQCWLMNGYRIARLRLREGHVEFTRAVKSRDVAKVGIPDVFLSPVPIDAKYELENYFRYIIKKYGL